MVDCLAPVIDFEGAECLVGLETLGELSSCLRTWLILLTLVANFASTLEVCVLSEPVSTIFAGVCFGPYDSRITTSSLATRVALIAVEGAGQSIGGDGLNVGSKRVNGGDSEPSLSWRSFLVGLIFLLIFDDGCCCWCCWG